MYDLFEQDFRVRVNSFEKHPTYSYDIRRWVVRGVLRAYLHDNNWGPGDFQWGFRIIVLVEDEELIPEMFRPCDNSGTYSDFFRAIIWWRVRKLLTGRIQ